MVASIQIAQLRTSTAINKLPMILLGNNLIAGEVADVPLPEKLVFAFQKQKGKWLIRAIDYTNGSFGKQIPKLSNPAYTNPKE